jgi:hypothetical protein
LEYKAEIKKKITAKQEKGGIIKKGEIGRYKSLKTSKRKNQKLEVEEE